MKQDKPTDVERRRRRRSDGKIPVANELEICPEAGADANRGAAAEMGQIGNDVSLIALFLF